MWQVDKTSADLSVQRWKGHWFICPSTVQSSHTSHSATSYHRREDVSEPCESRGQGWIGEKVLDEQSKMKNGVCVRCSEAVWAMRDGSECCGCLWQGVHSPLLASSLAHKHITSRPSPNTHTHWQWCESMGFWITKPIWMGAAHGSRPSAKKPVARMLHSHIPTQSTHPSCILQCIYRSPQLHTRTPETLHVHVTPNTLNKTSNTIHSKWLQTPYTWPHKPHAQPDLDHPTHDSKHNTLNMTPNTLHMTPNTIH